MVFFVINKVKSAIRTSTSFIKKHTQINKIEQKNIEFMIFFNVKEKLNYFRMMILSRIEIYSIKIIRNYI